MTKSLTQREQFFIGKMQLGPEQEGWGFELLAKHDDPARFFDALRDAGLLDAKRNSGPIHSGEPGLVSVPYWSALDYLVACAKHSERDLDLATKVMKVVRAVSTAADESTGRPRDNYHTWRKFAEIFAHLPSSVVTEPDLELIRIWLDSEVNTSLVTNALDAVISRFLGSESATDWVKACEVLRICISVRWVEDPSRPGRKRPVTAADDYWLKKLLEHHARPMGVRAGKVVAEMMTARLSEVFGPDAALSGHYLRPAVEEHQQNFSWQSPANRFVEGLRESLIGWTEARPAEATRFVADALTGNEVMLRRIAVYVVNKCWAELHGTFLAAIGPGLFDVAHLHEMYGLLRDRFGVLGPDDRARIRHAIRDIPLVTNSQDPLARLKRLQSRYLSAMFQKGDAESDRWYLDLRSDESIGLDEHPDFISWHEVRWGPGRSQFHVSELLGMAREGTLIGALNEFEEAGGWRAPTIGALVDALEEAVVLEPGAFLEVIPQFLNAKRAYQYGLINGLRQAWQAPIEQQKGVPWTRLWQALMGLCVSILKSPGFWEEGDERAPDLVPVRSWIPPLMADMLKIGTENDEHSYDEVLLDAGWSILEELREHVRSATAVPEDPINDVMNSPRGRVLESVFSHALRVCRLADRRNASHESEWIALEPVFSAELRLGEAGGNYELYVLAGSYLMQLRYLNAGWVEDNLKRLFPLAAPNSFACAVAGLVHANLSQPAYKTLVAAGIIDGALASTLKGRQAREHLVWLVALDYVWGGEELRGPRMSYLFAPGHERDLEFVIVNLGRGRDDALGRAEAERVIEFWERSLEWCLVQPAFPAQTMSSLGLLAAYLEDVGQRELRLLLAAAPHVKVGYNADYFVEQLNRLALVNSSGIASVLEALLEHYAPGYDYEDHLVSTLERLARGGQGLQVITLTKRVAHLEGARRLHEKLTKA